MSTKERLDCRIKEIEESKLSNETKKILIKMFRQIWPDYEQDNLDTYLTWLCFPCNHGDILLSIPEWLCNILGISKKRCKNFSKYGYEYDVYFSSELVYPSYDFSNKLYLIEKAEKENSIILKKSNSIAKKKSLDELKKLKKNLERDLSIIKNAIDIREKTEKSSKQKTYSK